MGFCALAIQWICVLQDDIYCSMGLAVRDNEVESKAWLPLRLPAGFKLIKSGYVFQTIRLDHRQSSANSHLRKTELDPFQRFWINDSLYLLHAGRVTREKELVCALVGY